MWFCSFTNSRNLSAFTLSEPLIPCFYCWRHCSKDNTGTVATADSLAAVQSKKQASECQFDLEILVQ